MGTGDLVSSVGGRPRLTARAAIALGLSLVLFGTVIGGLVVLLGHLSGIASGGFRNWLVMVGVALGPICTCVAAILLGRIAGGLGKG